MEKNAIAPSVLIANYRRLAYCILFTLFELLVVTNDFFLRFFKRYRRPIVVKEIIKAGISPTDSVLVVGCGIFPSTAIVIAEETGADVVGIDNNKKAVTLAKAYLKQKGLSKKIRLFCEDGTQYPVHDYDVIVLVANIFPIEKIISQVAMKTKPGATIICRGMKNDIAHHLKKEELSDILQVKNLLDEPMFTFSRYPTSQTYFLRRKK